MSDTNNNGEQVTKTDSNLPILFANGYPTSLESMKIESLELFLPFLVACSEEKQDLTSVQTKQKAPSWWPEKELPFTIPLKRPRRLKKVSFWRFVQNFEKYSKTQKIIRTTCGRQNSRRSSSSATSQVATSIC